MIPGFCLDVLFVYWTKHEILTLKIHENNDSNSKNGITKMHECMKKNKDFKIIF